MVISETLDTVKNNIGVLAVQVLASRYEIATMDNKEIIRKYHDIVVELMDTADDVLPH